MGSLFDGIGGFPLAAVRNGVIPLWASEIEAFPIEVTKHHFPDMLHVGDITKLSGAELPPVYCAKHNTHGKWICTSHGILILFYYNGIKYTLPFDAVFTEKTLPWLKESASLMMESKIEEIDFIQHDLSLKGGLLDG